MRMSCLMVQSFRETKRRWGANLILVLCVASAFLVLGTFLLITFNLREAERDLKKEVQIEVYLKDDITALELHLLLQNAKRLQEQERVDYRSREKALAELRDYLGDDVLKDLDSNPLPASLLISLKDQYKRFGRVAHVASRLQGQAGVEDVEFGGAWLERLDRAFSMFVMVDIIFGILVGVSVVLIVASFMKPVVLSQTEYLQIMNLLGASRVDICVPISIQGLFFGGSAASLAMVSLWAGHSVFTARVIDLTFLTPPVIFGLIASGALLGAGGALLSIRNRL